MNIDRLDTIVFDSEGAACASIISPQNRCFDIEVLGVFRLDNHRIILIEATEDGKVPWLVQAGNEKVEQDIIRCTLSLAEISPITPTGVDFSDRLIELDDLRKIVGPIRRRVKYSTPRLKKAK